MFWDIVFPSEDDFDQYGYPTIRRQVKDCIGLDEDEEREGKFVPTKNLYEAASDDFDWQEMESADYAWNENVGGKSIWHLTREGIRWLSKELRIPIACDCAPLYAEIKGGR